MSSMQQSGIILLMTFKVIFFEGILDLKALSQSWIHFHTRIRIYNKKRLKGDLKQICAASAEPFLTF
jgi:hypothetical protein